MTSIKVKFRPSTAKGKEGTIYYQIIHKRIIRQLKTDYRIFTHEWNVQTRQRAKRESESDSST